MATKRSVARSNTNGPDPTEADIDAVEQRIDSGNESERERAAWWKSSGSGSPEQEVITSAVVDALPEQVEQAAQAIVDAQPEPVLDPVVYEARRFELFKEDLYRCLLKHKYTIGGPGAHIQLHDVCNVSRVKRQLAIGGFVESLERAP